MRALNDDIHDLGTLLGDVIREQEGEEAFALVESLRVTTRDRRKDGADTTDVAARLAGLATAKLEIVVRAFSLYFLLANLAEENERVRHRRGAGKRKQTLAEAIDLLAARGLSADEVERIIDETPLMLTFTAHPTEMRRQTVRAHLEAIAAGIDGIDEVDVRASIAARVEALWGTLELRRTSPTVIDEVKGGLRYVGVLAGTMGKVERDLRRAFAARFGRALKAGLPLSLHSWMGGDRDGNPNVTADVTRETLRLHRARGNEIAIASLEALFTTLSQHTTRLASNLATKERVAGDVAPKDEEPFRDGVRELVYALRDKPGFDATPGLEAVRDAIVRAGQTRSAEVFVDDALCRARVLGAELAVLDLREHSEKVSAAAAALMKRGGGPSTVTPAEHRARLEAELSSKRPFLAVGEALEPELALVLEPLRVLREEKAATTPFVVSMTHEATHLLEVLVLAREAGADVMPVPLFETLEDLRNAPRVVEELLASSSYRAWLGPRVQEVMLGYSDSNKDAGPVAATFALHEAQRAVSAICRKANVRWRFFHGRGTSIGRGGGPMARAILGQPAGTIGAGLRVTEQGEALADKYARPELAHRNLEQAIYALLVSAAAPAGDPPADWLEAMAAASETSRETYRALVEHPAFLPFFESVTPIEEIARLRIASRPVRRAGSATLHNLRAIPWVMAWTQTRANVPGWYGIHTALATIGTARARTLHAEWMHFRSMIDNVSMALAQSDEAIFRAYLTLDRSGSDIGAQLLAARAEAIARIEEVTGARLLASEPRLKRSIELRNPYIEPIHRAQVELLARARRGEMGPVEERALLASILGIAAGVRNAG